MRKMLSIVFIVLIALGLYMLKYSSAAQHFRTKIESDINGAKVNFMCEDKLSGRGCCSRHNGVCGCRGSRALCCDGSLSPSCGCRADY